ncbi:MAG: hypothetical protein ABI700_08645 [Chloroflexota bacterium]
MNTQGEKAERFVEDVFAQFDSRACNRRVAEAADWENGLTDFEWINFWASLYSSEVASAFSEPTPIKQ